MLKESILNRIESLGGNTSDIKGESLKEIFESISFNSVMYPKQEDTPWSKASEAEPIYGINEFVKNNEALLKLNKSEFYNKLVSNFYTLTEEPYAQVFFRNWTFTPFKEGTDDYNEWNGEWELNHFKETIKGEAMDLMIIAYAYGYPDHHFICLSDPNPENPTVYGTDHEVYFDEISVIGLMEDYYNSFLTKEELLVIAKAKLDN